MSVVGVDFGLQTSLIAAAGRGGVDVLLNGASNRLNPTMVGFDRCRSMGEVAAMGAMTNYRNTITNMKRLIGLAFDDPRAQLEMKQVAFKCVPVPHAEGGPNSIGVEIDLSGETKVLPIETVAGMMVKHLGYIAAEKAAAGSVGMTTEQLLPQDWVIAVPNYYTDAQRRAFLAGCESVGITGVQRLMHESTAIALAYGIFKDLKKEFTKDKPTNVMIIDMGASAYTVSVAAFEPGKLTVKSAYCDPDLGGRDIDQVIAEWLAEKFEAKYAGKLSGKPMESVKVRLKLLAAAEKAKKTLSPQGVTEARINLECLMDELDFSIALLADEYEKLVAPLLARLAKPIESALEEAKLTSADLASVEIVGGSTRIGCFKRELTKILGQNMSTTMNADEAVARGAALQSAILSPRFKVLPYEIQEAQPYPIKISWDEEVGGSAQQGVEVDGDVEGSNLPTNSVVMFDRGLNFPIVRRVTLRRSGDFVVKAAYDDSAVPYGLPQSALTEIATFKIKMPASEDKKVRVNVKQDIHGIITLSSAQMVEEIEEEAAEVEVKEGEEPKEADKKKKIKKTNLEFTLSRPLNWTKGEIEKAYEAEVAMSNTDRVYRETSDMRNELESYIYDMRDKIVSDSHLAPFCNEEEKSKFTSALESTENWLYEDGFDATKSVYAEKLTELKKIGGPIEQRQFEAQSRSTAVASLQGSIERYKSWLNESTSDPKYAHITEEERQLCHAKCDEISAWLYDMLDKQGSLPQSVDAVLKVADIHTKNSELTKVCNPVMLKPAPKVEPPKEEPKKEEPAPAPAADGEEIKPEPMETEKPAENGTEPVEMEMD